MKKWLKRKIDWRVAIIAAIFTAFLFQAKKNFVDPEKDLQSRCESIIKNE